VHRAQLRVAPDGPVVRPLLSARRAFHRSSPFR
jgi:hypothetical protein